MTSRIAESVIDPNSSKEEWLWFPNPRH